MFTNECNHQAQALPPTMHLMKDLAGVELPKVKRQTIKIESMQYFGSLVDEKSPILDALKDQKEEVIRILALEKMAQEKGDVKKANEYKAAREKLLNQIQSAIAAPVSATAQQS